MTIELTPQEARVIGCLLEKEFTTPDQYPLTLVALTAACNQKSNRDPVLNLEAAAVQQILDDLLAKHLVSDRAAHGGRVPRYHHRFCNTLLSALQFTDLERALVCELLLRGPQSEGELRIRCARMTPVSGAAAITAALQALEAHAEGPLVRRLPLLPGTREHRWAHLLCGEPHIVVGAPAAAPAGVAARLDQLESEVDRLRAELEEVRLILQRGGTVSSTGAG